MFWMAQHHFQLEGTKLILMVAMHLRGVTRNLRIGAASTSYRLASAAAG